MPSIKKSKLFNDETISDEEYDNFVEQEEIEFLKNNFTLSDYLNCPKTFDVLEERREEKFEEELVDPICNLYGDIWHECRDYQYTMLAKDEDCECAFKILNLIEKYCEKKYDINVFYENTHLAKPLIVESGILDEVV